MKNKIYLLLILAASIRCSPSYNKAISYSLKYNCPLFPDAIPCSLEIQQPNLSYYKGHEISGYVMLNDTVLFNRLHWNNVEITFAPIELPIKFNGTAKDFYTEYKSHLELGGITLLSDSLTIHLPPEPSIQYFFNGESINPNVEELNCDSISLKWSKKYDKDSCQELGK